MIEYMEYLLATGQLSTGIDINELDMQLENADSVVVNLDDNLTEYDYMALRQHLLYQGFDEVEPEEENTKKYVKKR